MNHDDNTKRYFIRQLKWSVIYVGIGLVLVLVLPFSYDFTSVLGLFILINFIRGRSIMKKYGGIGGIRDLLGTMSDNSRSRPLKYYCMSCGKEHNKIACPNCGSKMKRVG